MSCAWPDPGHRGRVEFCENGARAVTWEATPATVPTSFWAEHSRHRPAATGRSTGWASRAGSSSPSTSPPAATTTSRSAGTTRSGWSPSKLRGLDSPDEAAFYTSGRTANETAFVYQLFVRAFGTNNLPDCSNMCHESTGTAMLADVGIGKSTIAYDDFAKADLIIVMGQNPGTNHPRMLTALRGRQAARRDDRRASTRCRRRACARYKNPQDGRAGSSAAAPTWPTSSCRSAAAATWRCCSGSRGGSWRRRTAPRDASSTTSSSPSTPSVSTSCGRTWRRSTSRRCVTATGLTRGRDRRAGRPLPRRRPRRSSRGRSA